MAMMESAADSNAQVHSGGDNEEEGENSVCVR
jgi:hypothetical protein